MPRWWPEGEQWPPYDPAILWRRRRYGFMRRVWIGIALMWWFSGLGVFSIYTRVSDRPFQSVCSSLRSRVVPEVS